MNNEVLSMLTWPVAATLGWAASTVTPLPTAWLLPLTAAGPEGAGRGIQAGQFSSLRPQLAAPPPTKLPTGRGGGPKHGVWRVRVRKAALFFGNGSAMHEGRRQLLPRTVEIGNKRVVVLLADGSVVCADLVAQVTQVAVPGREGGKGRQWDVVGSLTAPTCR